MGKPKNASATEQVTLSLSDESVRVLRELAILGIYGKNEAEIAARFVDKALEGFVVPPRFELPLRKQSRRALGRAPSKQQGKRLMK
jgi:hypothetical protein